MQRCATFDFRFYFCVDDMTQYLLCLSRQVPDTPQQKETPGANNSGICSLFQIRRGAHIILSVMLSAEISISSLISQCFTPLTMHVLYLPGYRACWSDSDEPQSKFIKYDSGKVVEFKKEGPKHFESIHRARRSVVSLVASIGNFRYLAFASTVVITDYKTHDVAVYQP